MQKADKNRFTAYYTAVFACLPTLAQLAKFRPKKPFKNCSKAIKKHGKR